MFRTPFHGTISYIRMCGLFAEIKCHHDYEWNKRPKTKTECFLHSNLKIKLMKYSLDHMYSKV